MPQTALISSAGPSRQTRGKTFTAWHAFDSTCSVWDPRYRVSLGEWVDTLQTTKACSSHGKPSCAQTACLLPVLHNRLSGGRQGRMFATHRRRLSSGCSKSQEESYVIWKLGAPLTTDNPRNLSNGLCCLCVRFYPRKSREKHSHLVMHWTYCLVNLILSLGTPHSHLSSLDLRGSRL